MFGGLKVRVRNDVPSGQTPSSSPATAKARTVRTTNSGGGPLSDIPQRQDRNLFGSCMPSMPSMPKFSIFGGKKPPPPPQDFNSKLEDNLKFRLGQGRAQMEKAHAHALATAEGVANAGGTAGDLMNAIDHDVYGNKKKMTPEERMHLKYATYAQVASTHYTVAGRYHGDAQSQFSTHNLPKIVQNGETPPEQMSPDQLNAALTAGNAPYQDPLWQSVKAFQHINGGTQTSPFVSVAEDPIAFAHMTDNTAAQNIVNNTPVMTTYMIPNQHLTKPEDIEHQLWNAPEVAGEIAASYKLDTIFHADPVTGAPRIYEDSTPTIGAKEALYMGNQHLDTYAIGRTDNPYAAPPPAAPQKTTLADLFAADDAANGRR
jgi:hypothetical protein